MEGCLEYCFSSSLFQFICIFTLHNLLGSKFASSPNLPHPQFDNHRRFSAYPSLKFLAVLLIALFIKHCSNSFLRGPEDIIVYLQSQKTFCNISIHCFWFGMLQEKSLRPFTSQCYSTKVFLCFLSQLKIYNNIFVLTGQQRIPFLYQSALSSSICFVYVWNWTIIQFTLFPKL